MSDDPTNKTCHQSYHPETDTPETDRHVDSIHWEPGIYADANFTRSLERQRDAARAELADLKAKLTVAPLKKRIKELEEALGQKKDSASIIPDGTPTAKHDLLTAHIKVCEKHPMRDAGDTKITLTKSLQPEPEPHDREIMDSKQQYPTAIGNAGLIPELSPLGKNFVIPINHDQQKFLSCPYCHAENEVHNNGQQKNSKNEPYELVCKNCEKSFTFCVFKRFILGPNQLDCLNEPPHNLTNWHLIENCGGRIVKSRRCRTCGFTELLSEPAPEC